MVWYTDCQIFKPGACWPQVGTCLVHASASVCVSASTSKTLITSDVIWDDIDPVRLVKQVLVFSCFIIHMALIKWMGMALVTQDVMNICQRRLR